MPKFLLAIYGDENAWANFSQEDIAQALKQYWEFGDEIERAGVSIAGEALQPTATARTVRMQDRTTSVTDGPFAETKETLGGFYLLECKDQDEAIEWAKKIPAGVDVEVRQIQEYERP
jgi:hypothetical protein